MFACEIANELDLEDIRKIMACAEWEIVPNRDYQTADVFPMFPGYSRIFFLRLPPNGVLHRHVDCGDCKTDHIVVETNPQALNWWMENGLETSMHMEEGKRYTVDRTVLHWATNYGPTNRTHLLLEY